MKYRIVADFPLRSDWLPDDVFDATFPDTATAISTAIEGVVDPSEEVLVVEADTGKVVWRSTEEKYED